MIAPRLILVGLLALLPVLGQCATVTVDFETELPANAIMDGSVAVQADQVHGGARSLRIEKGGELLIPVSPADGFGTVKMWVYDSGSALEGDTAKQRLIGPVWGLGNVAAQRLVFGLLYAPYLDGNASYGWISTAAGDWASRRYARSRRSAGWHEWVFTVNNETDIVVTVDGAPATGFDMMTSKFFRGFSGVYLRGAVDMDEPLVVDDIEVSWVAEPLTERTLPLPGEKRKAPEVEPLGLKAELAGKHPRLFFSGDDIDSIRERCKTTHADFFNRLMGGADGYLGQMPPANAASCADDQSMQQWAWWRLTTLAFGYIATGDERYGQKAAEWLDIFCAYPDWGTGEEINQSMGAANMLTGVACAYDWCYDLLSEEQRETIRAKLLRQVGELYWAGFMDPKTGGYWKGDEQNNHRHHRLCGLMLGALAIAGEVDEGEAYLAAATGEARKVAEAIPTDGSSHEGPHYSAFGYNYVVLLFDALRHCTGTDLFDAPGLKQIPYFRAHMLTPGFHDTFNISDCGRGAYYFNHYLLKLPSEYEDSAAQALMKSAYDAEPGSFSYYPWCILWYDAELEHAALDEIPNWRYFDDMEMVTYRSSWTDPDALAVVLKCGPYGGHRLNELARGWVNIAHDHPDANHFMLFWKGQMWALDDGYPKRDKAGKNHNIILVDGKGPFQRGGGWLQPIANMADMGRIDKVIQQPGLFAARGDAKKYYAGMDAMYRWLAVVGDKYVVIVDYLLSSTGPREFTWLMHSDADWTDVDGGAYRLTREAQSLNLRLLAPETANASVEKDILEDKDRGHVLTASPAEATDEAWFVSVLSMDDCSEASATEGEDGLTVTLPDGSAVKFDIESGDVEVTKAE